MDIETASSRFLELAASASATAPDQRRLLLDTVILPALDNLSRGDTFKPSEAVMDAIVAACHDPWSAIRKAAAHATARALRNAAAEYTSFSTGVPDRIIAPLHAFAAEVGTGGPLPPSVQASWYQAHGALLFIDAVRAADPDAVRSHPEWTFTAVLPAAAHPQLPVREAAVSLVDQFALCGIKDDAAVNDAVKRWLLNGDVSSASSAAVQGALSLCRVVPAAAERLVADSASVQRLAGADDAAVRQLVAQILSPASGAFMRHWPQDNRTATALHLLQLDDWAANETALLSLDSTFTRALRLANDDPNGSHPYASPTEQPSSAATAMGGAADGMLVAIVKRVASLLTHPRFETSRMAKQVLPLVCQLAIRRASGFADADDDALCAFTSSGSAVLAEAAYFGVLRRTLDAVCGEATPVSVRRVVEEGANQNAAIAFAWSIYGAGVVGDEGAPRSPGSPGVLLASPRAIRDASSCLAFLDAARLLPTAASRILPRFFTDDGAFDALPVHAQAAVLAAADGIFSASPVLFSSSSLISPSEQVSSRSPRKSARSCSIDTGAPDLAASAGPGVLASAKSFHVRSHGNVFTFVDHDDFAPPEILDGGADVSNGRAWLKAASRSCPQAPAAADGPVEERHAVIGSAAYSDVVIPAIERALCNRATDLRVVHHARHALRSAFTTPEIISAVRLLESVVKRLDVATPAWRTGGPSSDLSDGASDDDDDWDASSSSGEADGDDGAAGAAGISLPAELAAAHRALTGIRPEHLTGCSSELLEDFRRIVHLHAS